MIQNLMIKVESVKPLDQYGEGHVLVYNQSTRTYEVTSRENLLAPQNEKIKQLEKHCSEVEKLFNTTKEEMSKTLNAIKEEFSDFLNKTEIEKQTFLTTYKETNSKLIEMVKKAI